MSEPNNQVESAEDAGAPLAEEVVDMEAFKAELLAIVSDTFADLESRLFVIERAVNLLGASDPVAVQALADRLTTLEQRIKHFL